MTLGPDILLDPLTHDLDFEGGDLKLAVDVGQAVKIRLLFFVGDWFLNTAIGIPYFEQIFKKNPRLDQISALYREEIAGTPGVASVLSVLVGLNTQTRELDVTWKADSFEGEIGGVVEIV